MGLSFGGMCLASGVLMGILFGLPRKLQQEREFKSYQYRGTQKRTSKAELHIPYESNSNLEVISDWLTKIIVGVSLIEFRNIATFVDTVSSHAAVALGGYSTGYPFALSLSLFSLVDGFLLGYFWARFYLFALLVESEILPFEDQSETQPPEANSDTTGSPTRLSLFEEKIMHTLWRLQALHSPTLDKAITFTILPASPEFDDFYSAANRLIGRSLLLPSSEGQYFLSAQGLRYCQEHYESFSSGYWYEDISVTPEMLERLKASVQTKYTAPRNN
jgi:hypothetical protein